ncbi:hypothetical protein HDU76_002424, partial [Blyttiomyces sp. JEL0837]
MAECGLTTVTATVKLNGQLANLVSMQGSKVTGLGTFEFMLQDDMPYYGGTLIINPGATTPCSFTGPVTPAMIAPGLSISYTVLPANQNIQLMVGKNFVPAIAMAKAA